MSCWRYLVILLLLSLFGCSQPSVENKGQPDQEPSPATVSQPSTGANTAPGPASPESQAEKDLVPAIESATSTGDPPHGEPLLLLDEGQGTKTDSAADNSRCLVCHLNYELEDIALVHANAGYGCAHCHGQSDAHIADESWASGGNGTPPDVMYRPEEVIPACLKCHELSKSDPECRCEFPRLPEKKSCTDCHGTHRLKSRKCRWK